MATWDGKQVDKSAINNGNQYNDYTDAVNAAAVNAAVNNSLYAVDFVDTFGNGIDTSEIDGYGTASASLVSVTNNGRTFKKLKLSRLKGKGIKKVEQTTTSTTDGGTNVVRVTLDDNTYTDFNVKNGNTGGQGPQGIAAGFGTPTATIDGNIGIPSVTVTASGSNTAKVFNFAFKNLKGERGATGTQGIQGDKGETGFTSLIGFWSLPSTPTVGMSETQSLSYFSRTPVLNELALIIRGDSNVGKTYACYAQVNAFTSTSVTIGYTQVIDITGKKGDKGDTGASITSITITKV